MGPPSLSVPLKVPLLMTIRMMIMIVITFVMVIVIMVLASVLTSTVVLVSFEFALLSRVVSHSPPKGLAFSKP